MGGQIPNNLAQKLKRDGVKILGTSVENIDRAESRDKFSALCDTLGIDQPLWKAFHTVSEAEIFSDKVGYPCSCAQLRALGRGHERGPQSRGSGGVLGQGGQNFDRGARGHQ